MKKKQLNFASGDYSIFTDKSEDVYAGLKSEVVDKVQALRVSFHSLSNAPDTETLLLFKLKYNEQLSGWDIDINNKVEVKVNLLHEHWVKYDSTLEEVAKSIKK